jgi:hypothetical protein
MWCASGVPDVRMRWKKLVIAGLIQLDHVIGGRVAHA